MFYGWKPGWFQDIAWGHILVAGSVTYLAILSGHEIGENLERIFY